MAHKTILLYVELLLELQKVIIVQSELGLKQLIELYRVHKFSIRMLLNFKGSIIIMCIL